MVPGLLLCGCCHYWVATVAGPPTCRLDCFVAVIATVCRPQLATTCHKSLNCTKFSSHALAVSSNLLFPCLRLASSFSLRRAFLLRLALTGRTINVFALQRCNAATFCGIQMWPQLSRNENFNFLSSAFVAHNYKSPKAVAAGRFGGCLCHMMLAATSPSPHPAPSHAACCLVGQLACTRYSILHFTTNACLTLFSWRAKISHVSRAGGTERCRGARASRGGGGVPRALCLSFT